MNEPYSFLEKEQVSESIPLDPQVQAKINVWVYVSLAFAALYLIVALTNIFISTFFLKLWCIVVAILSAFGGILLKKKNYDTAWMLWRIAGIMGLPLGLVLLIGRALTQNLVKKVEDEEFQRVLNKAKQ